MNKLKFYFKLAIMLLTKKVINKDHYKVAYDEVAQTYEIWLREMGQHINGIIRPELFAERSSLKILDFACGTGHISREILNKGIDCEIVAVDISENMLEKCKDLQAKGVSLVNEDGFTYLNKVKKQKQKFDIIFCGWAMPYFEQGELIKLFKSVLKKDGYIAVIANSQGTLDKIEEIFLTVMEKNPEQIQRPMDIRFNLPKGEKGLRRWFAKNGLHTVYIGQGEQSFVFKTPEELLEWLNKSGALAGTKQIFKNYEHIKEDLIHEIKRQKHNVDGYQINHKFVYGIFSNGVLTNE